MIRLLTGDALSVLGTLPDASVHACVTSPPYYSLRDYGVPGQIGMESTLEEYLGRLVQVFREVRRVLRPDGTLFLNIGDSYATGDAQRGAILSPSDAAWLAALIDGEGCIQAHCQRQAGCADAYQVDVGVGMMDPEAVQYAHRVTSLGSCTQQARGVWDWSVRGQQAADLLRAIYSRLLIKRRQAALAIMLAEDLAGRKFGRGNPATPEALAYRAAIKQAISDLNQRQRTSFSIREPRPIEAGLKPKDLLLVPAQLALALRHDGWFLRAELVWHKPNCLPEPIKDRPTRNHELIYLFARQATYFYDHFNGREPAVEAGKKSGNKERRHAKGDVREKDRGFATAGFPWVQGAMRNWRTVWTITNKPFKGAHFATFPVEIPERAILVGTSDFGCCLECGAPWRRLVEKVGGPPPGDTKDKGVPQGEAVGRDDARGRNAQLREVYETHGYPEWKTTGAEPSCPHVSEDRKPLQHRHSRHRTVIPGGQSLCTPGEMVTTGAEAACAHEFQGLTEPCTVLDPFCGAGTTGLVAGKLGRHFIGIDLSPAYVQLAAERLRASGLEVEVVGEAIPDLEGVEEQAPLLVG